MNHSGFAGEPSKLFEEEKPTVTTKGRTTKPTPTSAHTQTVEFWCERWKGRHGTKYIFGAGKDGAFVKKILQAVEGDADKARAIITAYLESDDRFFAEKRHPLGMLVGNLSRFLADAEGTPAAGMTTGKKLSETTPGYDCFPIDDSPRPVEEWEEIDSAVMPIGEGVDVANLPPHLREAATPKPKTVNGRYAEPRRVLPVTEIE